MIKKRKDSLTLREARARVVACPRCKRDAGQPCVSGDLDLIRAHSERMEAYNDFVREEYCRNESQSGYPCGVPGCRSCGGQAPDRLTALEDAMLASVETMTNEEIEQELRDAGIDMEPAKARLREMIARYSKPEPTEPTAG